MRVTRHLSVTLLLLGILILIFTFYFLYIFPWNRSCLSGGVMQDGQ